jgi:importin subunit beta-1
MFQDQNVQREVKPQILSVLGDVALAVGPEFRKYLEVVLQTLMQASQAQVDRVRLLQITFTNFTIKFS